MRLSVLAIDPRLENAARTLGVFFTITLPLAMQGILVGAVLALSRRIAS